jgi:hypothetical protein
MGPLCSGLVYGIGAISLISAIFSAAALLEPISAPSQEVFRSLTEVGIGMFLAFSIATAGAGIRTGESIDDHLNWLGTGCGIGVCGLVSIGTSVALAAHREAGHASSIDIIGVCWIGASVLAMGTLVALLPYAVYSWSRPIEGD